MKWSSPFNCQGPTITSKHLPPSCGKALPEKRPARVLPPYPTKPKIASQIGSTLEFHPRRQLQRLIRHPQLHTPQASIQLRSQLIPSHSTRLPITAIRFISKLSRRTCPQPQHPPQSPNLRHFHRRQFSAPRCSKPRHHALPPQTWLHLLHLFFPRSSPNPTPM